MSLEDQTGAEAAPNPRPSALVRDKMLLHFKVFDVNRCGYGMHNAYISRPTDAFLQFFSHRLICVCVCVCVIQM
jgi:hypothetical protein